MQGSPDAYARWLGIREPQRPLNHYQVLGLRPFETNADVIQRAFANQKARLERHAQGENARLAKRILMELESARNCLLNEETRAAYDDTLRSALQSSLPPATADAATEPLGASGLAPLDPLDPLNAQIAGLERVNSLLGQLPATAAPSEKAAPATAPVPPTMYSYAGPPPRRRTNGKSSGLMLGICLGAGAVIVIAVVGYFMTRGLGQLASSVSEEVAAAAAETQAEASESPPPIKPKNTRLLINRPVTAKSDDESSERKSPVTAAAQDSPDSPPEPAQSPPRAPTPTAARAPQPVSKPARASAPLPKSSEPAPEQTPAEETPAEATVDNPDAESADKPRARVSVPPKRTPVPPGAKPVAPMAPSKPTATWPDLPLAVELPSLDDASNIEKPMPLGKLEVPEGAKCELEIVYGIENESPSYQFTVKTEAERPHVWTIAISAKIESNSELVKEGLKPVDIALFKLEDGQLVFQWLPDCVKVPAAKLRNAVLWIHVNDKKQRMQLRQAANAAPLLLDLTDEVLIVAFDPADLPPIDELQLELLEATDLPLVGIEPASRRVQGEDTLQLLVRQQPPGVELRLQLNVLGDKASVRAEPLIVDADGETMSFTTRRINTMAKELPVDIAKAKKELAELQGRINQLQAEIGAMGNRLRANGQANIRLTALRTSLNKAINSQQVKQARIAALTRRQGVLPTLINIGNQIHNKTTLRVRVFFVSGGEEVEVLSM